MIVGSPQLINLGLKYANRLNRKRLIEKIQKLLQHIEGKDDDYKEQNSVKLETEFLALFFTIFFF